MRTPKAIKGVDLVERFNQAGVILPGRLESVSIDKASMEGVTFNAKIYLTTNELQRLGPDVYLAILDEVEALELIEGNPLEDLDA